MEDSAGLGIAVAKSLVEKSNDDMQITFVKGNIANKKNNSSFLIPHSKSLIPHLQIVETIPNLSERLCEYDLVITHFGITAFEALYCGTAVLLVNPTRYHERLAKTAGFFSLGVGKKAAAKSSRLLFKNGGFNFSFFKELKDRCIILAKKNKLDQPPQRKLAELINGFTPNVNRNCPACGAACGSTVRFQQALARFPDRTYRRCKSCGVIFMDRLNPPPIEYGKEYFFEEYKKQYGKTYIEDFPNLMAMAKRRLEVIKKLFLKNKYPKDSTTNQHKQTRTMARYQSAGSCGLWLEKPDNVPSVLDIGCAYGPFLAAAREEGFSPYGLDPSEDAVRYVTQKLGIPAVQGYFLNSSFLIPHSSFSVITLWYVIEHFRDCVPVFTEIKKLLKPDGVNPFGVLAFSTPSFSGVSGRFSQKRFLERSPADHWTIWSPVSCKKALKAAGFTVKKIIVTGHHPERFPLLGKFASSPKSLMYKTLLVISKIFGLGDTFEVFAMPNLENV